MSEQNLDPTAASAEPTAPPAPAAEDTALAAADGEQEITRGEQKVTIEDCGPARKRLTIEIPESRISAKTEKLFGKLEDEAVLPGFRRGRAPRRLLEKRFASSVRDDVRSQLIAEAYEQAIADQKLDVIGEPETKPGEEIKLPDSGPMVFSFEIEVTPAVELPAFDSLQVQKTKVEINAERVAQEIERLRERFGKLVQAAAEAKVSEGDFLACDVRVLEGADAPDTAAEIAHLPEAYVLVPGASRQFKGHVAGIVVEELGRHLAGQSLGQTVRLSLTGPAGHEDERIKGKPITIVLRIDRTERLEPASREVLAERLGAEGPDKLEEVVRQRLESQRDAEQRRGMREQVCEQLLGRVKLDLPQGLSNRQASRLLQRQALEMMNRGMPEHEIRQHVAELRTGSQEQARRQLSLFFILDAAARQLDVDVSENEVNGQIAMLAIQQGRRPEKLRQEMQRQGQIEQLYLQVRDQKTLDKILEQAQVLEIDPAPAPAGDSEAPKAE